MSSFPYPLPEPVFVPVGGVPIATYQLSPGHGEAVSDVVFCHGTPWSARIWAQAARCLSSGQRVYLWDMPGYGQSAKGPGVAVDLATQMLRLSRLLAHWQLDAPFVVAHDIGGAVALGAHLMHGSEYTALFLWDVVVLEPWGSPFFRLVAGNAEVFEALPGALHAALVAEYIAGAAGQQLPDDALSMLTEPWLGVQGQAAFYRQIAALRSEHTRPVVERLQLVRCATAIGWGRQDPWIPYEQATRLQHLLPDMPPVTALAGIGHLAPIEAPLLVQAALNGWLSEPQSAGSVHS